MGDDSENDRELRSRSISASGDVDITINRKRSRLKDGSESDVSSDFGDKIEAELSALQSRMDDLEGPIDSIEVQLRSILSEVRSLDSVDETSLVQLQDQLEKLASGNQIEALSQQLDDLETHSPDTGRISETEIDRLVDEIVDANPTLPTNRLGELEQKLEQLDGEQAERFEATLDELQQIREDFKQNTIGEATSYEDLEGEPGKDIYFPTYPAFMGAVRNASHIEGATPGVHDRKEVAFLYIGTESPLIFDAVEPLDQDRFYTRPLEEGRVRYDYTPICDYVESFAGNIEVICFGHSHPLRERASASWKDYEDVNKVGNYIRERIGGVPVFTAIHTTSDARDEVEAYQPTIHDNIVQWDDGAYNNRVQFYAENGEYKEPANVKLYSV